MDFGYLLDLAKQNQQQAKTGVGTKRYSTEVSAAKKLPKSEVKVDAVKKLLAKQEEDEKKKLTDEKRKREQLLTLRSQDRKSNARVQAMLHRTKASNKAVMAEARDLRNTAVTMVGSDQPDVDDYGYVSREASDFFTKFIDKYGPGGPPDDFQKRPSLAHKAKERGKERQSKPSEEPDSCRKRERNKPVAIEEDKRSDRSGSQKDTSTPFQDKRKNRPAPPDATLSFNEILRLAAQKQKEPLAVDKKMPEMPKTKIPKIPEPDRPMTAKEKDEYLRKAKEEYERKLRKAGKLPPLNSTPSPVKTTPTTPFKVASKPAPHQASISKPPFKIPERKDKKLVSERKDQKPASTSTIARPNGSLSNNKNTIASSDLGKTNKIISDKKPFLPTTNGLAKDKDIAKGRVPPSKDLFKGKECPPKDMMKTPRAFPPKDLLKTRDFPPKDVLRPREFPPKDMLRSREFPPKDVLRSREFPPRDVMGKSRQFPPRDVSKLASKRPRLESDDEDSEMDDFIDDDPQEGEDYSKYIKEIFGYDRAKYRRIESDEEECMESSFAQQMREERISTRLGIMEDLEDIQREREEEERKKKLLGAKKKKQS